jgi:ketosteroid isomerase-like protein
MIYRVAVLALLLTSCEMKQEESSFDMRAQDEQDIRAFVAEIHQGLMRAYNGGVANTDSLLAFYYDKDIYYVTPWGWSEPIDSTKSRLRQASRSIKNYENRVENLTVKSFGDGAYAYFIFRQNYVVGGRYLEEYLPTTWILEKKDGMWKIIHAQRSTDYETMQQWVAMQRLQQGK